MSADVEELGWVIARERDKHPRISTDADSWEIAQAILDSDWLAARDAEVRRAAAEQIAQAIEAGRTSRPVGVSPTEHAASIAREVTR